MSKLDIEKFTINDTVSEFVDNEQSLPTDFDIDLEELDLTYAAGEPRRM